MTASSRPAAEAAPQTAPAFADDLESGKSALSRALTNPATTLYSTSYFYKRLEEEIARSERYRHFFSIVLVHVGLPADWETRRVDQLIRAYAIEAADGLNRRTDILCHFRKRQIVILMPETDRGGAEAVIRRTRDALDESYPHMRYASLAFPEDAPTIELVLHRLDALSDELFCR